ncbi:Uncharacterized protein dnm_067630 [Desulfonema magnum]|uniref:Uncharacterized protein n=1 Tax=Desulfonema magnum TaxID=45655 RepID=A0A975GR99_9BACT|nr:Uncharacterized protein dnm_067630 [Desulfonema magnum]
MNYLLKNSVLFLIPRGTTEYSPAIHFVRTLIKRLNDF